MKTRLALVAVVFLPAACGSYDSEGYAKPAMVMSPDGKSWLYDIHCEDKAECMLKAQRACKTHRYTIVDEAALGSQTVGVNSRHVSVSSTTTQNEMLIRCVTRAELSSQAE